jgi:hypothetical protein
LVVNHASQKKGTPWTDYFGYFAVDYFTSDEKKTFFESPFDTGTKKRSLS